MKEEKAYGSAINKGYKGDWFLLSFFCVMLLVDLT